MKIIVLHGDDTTKSYERLTKFMDEAKKREWEVLDFDLDSIFNQSLFEKERFYILRDIKKINKEILEKLKSFSGNLVLYHQSTLSVTILKTFNADKVERFELPKIIWNFLDTFSVKTFQEVLKTEATEMVVWWLAQRLKELYWVKSGNPNFSSWRINKLKSQASKYSQEQLEKAIFDLSEIDVKSKLGLLNLKDSIDLLLIKGLA